MPRELCRYQLSPKLRGRASLSLRKVLPLRHEQKVCFHKLIPSVGPFCDPSISACAPVHPFTLARLTGRMLQRRVRKSCRQSQSFLDWIGFYWHWIGISITVFWKSMDLRECNWKIFFEDFFHLLFLRNLRNLIGRWSISHFCTSTPPLPLPPPMRRTMSALSREGERGLRVQT